MVHTIKFSLMLFGLLAFAAPPARAGKGIKLTDVVGQSDAIAIVKLVELPPMGPPGALKRRDSMCCACLKVIWPPESKR